MNTIFSAGFELEGYSDSEKLKEFIAEEKDPFKAKIGLDGVGWPVVELRTAPAFSFSPEQAIEKAWKELEFLYDQIKNDIVLIPFLGGRCFGFHINVSYVYVNQVLIQRIENFRFARIFSGSVCHLADKRSRSIPRYKNKENRFEISLFPSMSLPTLYKCTRHILFGEELSPVPEKYDLT